MSEDTQRRRHKTFAPRLAPPLPVRARAKRGPARAPARPVIDPSTLRPSDRGRPLAPDVRRRLEESLGRPLGHVRVHTEAADRERAHALGARAFAHRHHIWLGRHESASDVGLLAHEVTHVAQQGFAPRSAAAVHGGAVSVGTRAAGSVARHGGSRAAAAPRAPARAVARVQRFDFDPFGAARRVAGAVASGVTGAGRAVVAGAKAVGGAVAEAGESLLAMGRDALLAVVRRIAPDFLPLFEGDGIVSFVRRLIERGLRSMFEGLVGPLRGIINFGAIGDRITQAVSWISAIAGQLARNDCSGILAAARRVGDFFSNALKPVVDRVRKISDQVSGFFKSIWDAIGAPIMDILKKIGGKIWESLKGFVADVAKVIKKVREALGDAWQRVKGWLGIRAETGEDEGGGLWDWIKEKARSVGDSVSNVIKPVIGPLRTVAGVLLLITPGGQALGVILLWPKLKQAWNWLSQKWTDLNLIPRARAFLANTVLPAMMSAAEAVGQGLVAAADWLLGLLERVESGLMTALGAAKGILSPLGSLLINFAHAQFRRFTGWARSGLRWASRNMHNLVRALVRFLGKVLEAMEQLIAIAVNPFGITGFLMGRIWLAIPECLKGPIIDFILDAIIGFLDAMPPMPTLGILWPLVKSAALGFLRKVKSFALQRKVNVSNKLAKIVSGQSVDFAFGFLKGIAIGVWEGIISPFQAIATVFDLPDMIQNFLSNLGIRLCDLIESIRCFMATLAGKVFGTLDDVLRGLQEVLENPSKIIELIQCAIEGALASASSIGATIAEQMMALFEGPDATMGEMLGKVVGNQLVQAVITYFTAGAGASIGIVKQISEALGAVGKAINEVVQMLTKLLGKLVGFLKGLASKFASAVARGAKSVLGKLGGFFKRVAKWFSKLLGKLFKGLRKRFMLSPQEHVQWAEFEAEVRVKLAGHPNGITRGQLRALYKGILSSHKSVAKWPAFIMKHGPNWRLWVRRVKSIIPRVVGHVMLDRDTRWKQGKKAVKKAIKRLKRLPGNIDAPMITNALRGVKRLFKYSELSATFVERENQFHIEGHMSPGQPVAKTPPKRPTRNATPAGTAHTHLTVDPLVKRSATRSAPSGSPPGWSAVQKIKTRSGSTSLYIRGHIISGFFTGGGSTNLTPIKRQANSLMATGAETPVRKALPIFARTSGRQPIFKYDVKFSGKPAAVPPLRKYRDQTGAWVCKRVSAEQKLHAQVDITVTKFEYNPTSHKWDRKVPGPAPGAITNVSPYPSGHKEPCTPP